MNLSATDRLVAMFGWDGFRLWELRAEYPSQGRAELAESIQRLLKDGLLICYPADDEAGPVVSLREAVAYIADPAQWLNMTENPWPDRGRIYEFLLTQEGQDALGKT